MFFKKVTLIKKSLIFEGLKTILGTRVGEGGGSNLVIVLRRQNMSDFFFESIPILNKFPSKPGRNILLVV